MTDRQTDGRNDGQPISNIVPTFSNRGYKNDVDDLQIRTWPVLNNALSFLKLW